MSTLYAFGCSNTYGEGLSDCCEPDTPSGFRPGKSPSTLAWPQIASDLLKLHCVNLAVPAASNRFILHRLLNSELKQNSTVVIGWTYSTRSCIIHTHKIGWLRKDLTTWPHWSDKVTTLMPAILEQNHFRGKKYWNKNKLFYKYLYDEVDLVQEMWRSIEMADLYLKSRGCAVIHTATDQQSRPEWVRATVLEHCVTSIVPNGTLAQDRRHPGEETHRLFGEYVAAAIATVKTN